MGVRLLVITGSMGAGKTTVMAEASDLLKEHDLVHAAIDLDGLAIGHYPDARSSPDLALTNLRAIWSNFRAAGAKALIVASALESRAERERLQAAVEADDVVICRLRASVETMRERIRVWERGMFQSQFVKRVADLESILDAAALEDFGLENDGRGVTAVAREMLVRAGWLSGEDKGTA